MKRINLVERPDWREKATEFGFNFHTMYGEPYWCEDAYYEFTLAQVEELEDATAEIHQMCLKAVERVVNDDALMKSQCTQVPAQAGMSAESHSGGSSWMPLMAGFMMGRMMSGGAGFAQQPLFTSKNAGNPANGKFVDATGKSYGPATTGRSMNVPKTAMAPKPATTSTITRGGFGESVAKQNTMQRSAASSSSRSGSRSMGG